MIRAIFFDFDGVLVDSEPLHFECWARVLARHGISLDAEGYTEKFIGVSNRDMIQILCRENGRVYGDALFDAWYAEKRAIFEARALAAFRIPDDVRRFILESDGRYSLGVVSSSARPEVEPHLVGQGIRHAVTALVCAGDVARLKPAPDPYLRALEIVNAAAAGPIEAAECLVVEDSGPGEEAGRAAGMPVLRVSGPSHVWPRLREALGV